MNNKYFRPIIPLLLSMISGIAAGSRFPGYEVGAYVVVFVIVCLIFHAICKKRTAFLLPIVLFVALGYLSIQSWITPRFPLNHVTHFTDTSQWEIVGVIDALPAKY